MASPLEDSSNHKSMRSGDDALTSPTTTNNFWSRFPLTVPTPPPPTTTSPRPTSSKIESTRPTLPTLHHQNGIPHTIPSNQAAPTQTVPDHRRTSPSRVSRMARLNGRHTSSTPTPSPTLSSAPSASSPPTPCPITTVATVATVFAFENAPIDIIAKYKDLKQSDTSTGKAGLFVAEGPETIKMLLQSNTTIESLLLKTSVYDRLKGNIEERASRCPTNPFAIVLVNGASNFTEHVGYTARGALAVGSIPTHRNLHWLRENVLLAKNKGVQWRILAIDGSNNPANIGNIIRSAKALEIDAVLLSERCCDPWLRRAVRVSMGHCFNIPIIQCTSLKTDLLHLQETDLVVCYSAVVTKNAALVGTGANKATPFVSKWCVVVGAEHEGVSKEILALTNKVKIPMSKGVDSLSITAATSILLAHFRQTNDATGGGNTMAVGGGGSGSKGGGRTELLWCCLGLALGVVVGQRIAKR